MATNRRFANGSPLSMTVPSPTKSNDPVVKGKLPGVALTDYDATTGKATVAMEGVYDVSVKAIDGGGNSAVVEGDPIYYVANDTPPLSKKNSGVFFGHALEGVTSGQTDTIMVRIQPSAP